jgi:hypothetical protein
MKLIKLLFVAILLTGCGGGNDDKVYQDVNRDLSGVYIGLANVTFEDVWRDAPAEITQSITTVTVVKFGTGYLTGNVTLDKEGYGTITIDSRDDCPYDTCQPRDSWYMIITNIIDINGNNMEYESIMNEYNYDGVLMSYTKREGILEKQ